MTHELPLNLRQSGEVDPRFQGLHEGIPPWLTGPLRGWMEKYLFWAVLRTGNGGSFSYEIEADLRVELFRLPGHNPHDIESLRNLIWSSSDYQNLNVIDWILRTHHTRAERITTAKWSEMTEELERYLERGGSAWRVEQPRTDIWELQRRLPDGTVEAYRRADQLANDPDQHLSSAWTAAFGRNPNPDEAYKQAIDAVEAAACPLILPNKPDATLGHVIGELRSNPKWDVVFRPNPTKAPTARPIESVAHMCELLWNSHPRHGNDGRGRSSQAEAEAAAILAATLVNWFAGKTVFRTQP